MELDQLRYFLRIAHFKSFTRASEELGISQPALSRSIQKLEEEFGVPVLVRKSKSVELTDAGTTLKNRAEQILSIVDDTKAEICDDGKTGRIRIGAIPTVAPYFLPRFLKTFARAFPEATVEIHEDTTKNLLHYCAQGDVDAAILALPVNDKYLETQELFEEELLLALPADHELTQKAAIRLCDIESTPFVILDEAHCLSDNILSFCRQRSFQPVVVGRTNQLAMVQELVSLSHGISMVPEMARRMDKAKTRVYRTLAGSTTPTRKIAIIWDPYRFQSRLMIRFREMLAEHSVNHTGN